MSSSPAGDPMKWGKLVGLKKTRRAKVVASKAVGALNLHCIVADGACGSLGESFILQQKMEKSVSDLEPLAYWCLFIESSVDHPSQYTGTYI